MIAKYSKKYFSSFFHHRMFSILLIIKKTTASALLIGIGHALYIYMIRHALLDMLYECLVFYF